MTTHNCADVHLSDKYKGCVNLFSFAALVFLKYSLHCPNQISGQQACNFLSPTSFFPIEICTEKDFFALKKIHSLLFTRKNCIIAFPEIPIKLNKSYLIFWQKTVTLLQGKILVKLRKLHHDITIKKDFLAFLLKTPFQKSCKKVLFVLLSWNGIYIYM